MSRFLLVTGLVLFLSASAFAGKPSVVPEIDAGSASVALTILAGGLALLRERFRK
jgi:hypothetical protein